MPVTVVSVQPTPNPNAMKYQLDQHAFASPISCFSRDSAHLHPLAQALFTIDGVASLLMLNDFITVTRTPGAPWKPITAAVRKAIASARLEPVG